MDFLFALDNTHLLTLNFIDVSLSCRFCGGSDDERESRDAAKIRRTRCKRRVGKRPAYSSRKRLEEPATSVWNDPTPSPWTNYALSRPALPVLATADDSIFTSPSTTIDDFYGDLPPSPPAFAKATAGKLLRRTGSDPSSISASFRRITFRPFPGKIKHGPNGIRNFLATNHDR